MLNPVLDKEWKVEEIWVLFLMQRQKKKFAEIAKILRNKSESDVKNYWWNKLEIFQKKDGNKKPKYKKRYNDMKLAL